MQTNEIAAVKDDFTRFYDSRTRKDANTAMRDEIPGNLDALEGILESS